MEELFDFEPDVLDTIDETEACSQHSNKNVADSQILADVQGQLSYAGKDFVSEPPPSINHSLPQAMDVDSPHDAALCDADRSLPDSSKRELQHMNAVRRLEARPHSINTKTLAQISLNNHVNNKSRVDYLTCCYLFQEAAYYFERSENILGKREHQVPRSNIDKLFAPYHRDKDKLLANPTIPLDMWSILCLIEPNQVSIPDDLLDRLDINDLQFMNAVDACLGLCKKWIELVVKGLPRDALQFDSLLLHQNARKAVQNIWRPMHEQGRFDIWQEAGYLFAFVWSNEQQEAANPSFWLQEAEISGLPPTHFLAMMCRIIVRTAATKSPEFRTISGKGVDDDKLICRLYVQAIRRIKNTRKLQTLKKILLISLFNHHTESDLDLEQRAKLGSVQSYQRRAADFLYKDERALAREFSQATTLHGDVQTKNSGSLASSRSTSSASYASSYLYTNQLHLTLLSSNPAMTRSLASGSSRGSSLNSFRDFRAASRAMATCLKEDQDEFIWSREK